jgi:hypothetical protein
MKLDPADKETNLSGANPTIASYNARVANFCNAKGAFLKQKYVLLLFKKRSSLLQHWR